MRESKRGTAATSGRKRGTWTHDLHGLRADGTAGLRRHTAREWRRRSIGLLAVATLGLLIAVFGLLLRTAGAQPAPPQPALVEALALAVAKVSANEASLAQIRPAEVALIWQVTEARADTPRGQLAWLRAHSSCVLTDRPMSDREATGNCRWSRHLTASNQEPEGWPAHLSWGRYAPRWAQIRAFARKLVIGESEMRPCPGEPFTWGGPMDRASAIERGLVPLGCRDPQTGERTLNEGFAISGGAS